MKASWLFPLLLPVFLGSRAGSPTVSDLARRWQGAWIVRDADYPGSVQAWNVHGDSVTVYDPVARHSETQSFVLQSPCRLVRKRSPDASGSETIAAMNTFAFGADGLHVGSPQDAGGLRSGPLLTVCTQDHLYTFDRRSGRCQSQTFDPSGATPTPPVSPASVECVLDTTPPSFVLRQLGSGQNVRLSFSGDALLSPALAGQVTAPQRSFQEAVKRADTLVTH
jgi:hypothetical protein